MRVSKLVNKKLMISYQEYKHMKMSIAQPLWAKNVFKPNEKRLSKPVLKGIEELKNSTNKVFMW